MKKESFDTRFDEICKERKIEKEKKKELFNKNIQSHIVYMDEYGKVYKKEMPENQKKTIYFENFLKCILIGIILALLIYIFYELIPVFYYLTN